MWIRIRIKDTDPNPGDKKSTTTKWQERNGNIKHFILFYHRNIVKRNTTYFGIIIVNLAQ